MKKLEVSEGDEKNLQVNRAVVKKVHLKVVENLVIGTLATTSPLLIGSQFEMWM